MSQAFPVRRLIAGGALAVAVFGVNTASAVTATTKKSTKTTAKSAEKTTTTIKSKSTTTTVKSKSSAGETTTTKTKSTSKSSASTTVPESVATTTPKASGPTTTLGPAKRGVAFIPGAGRVLDLDATQVGKLAAGGRVETDVRGASGLAASGLGTVLVDVTITNPTQAGKVTLTPVAPDFARSVVSNSVGFQPGSTTVARVAVPVGTNGLVRVATTAGPTGLAVAVVGWVVPTLGTPTEQSAIPIETCRLLDTVSGLGGLQGEVTPARPFDIPAVGIAKLPPALGGTQQPTGVLLTVGASQATGPLELSVVPTGAQTPSLVLSMAPGQSTSANFLVPVGADARAAFYVSANGLQLTVDAVAWIDREGVAHSGGPC